MAFGARSAGAVTSAMALPPNLVVGPGLGDLAVQMLRESPTFRRQVQFIARMQRIRVRMVLEDHPGVGLQRAARAQCELGRHEFGGITALVHVWSRDDAIELMAHELEHVIEVAEGMNYRAMTLLQPGAVWVAGNGAFETARAVSAGVRVKRELWLAAAQARRH